ncbi:hypothetical protein V0R52_14965 [Pseudomonas asiatica]|uniref:hypothetical protein n=1 Tax=Pseudomonas asiatica TaxID=2219225 RepID=UPI002E7BEA3D|nr:hypothetical protein [Pseudomonas asiatica]MEE1917693.1 hypothetical protein [Pseudomonas asiatica]
MQAGKNESRIKAISVLGIAEKVLARNGRFTTVMYSDEVGTKLPDDAATAARYIEIHLLWKLFDSLEYGLGLHRDLDQVWQGLSRIPNATILVVSQHPGQYSGDGVVSISVEELDELRRGFNRVTTNVRQLIHPSKALCTTMCSTGLTPSDSCEQCGGLRPWSKFDG